MDSRRRIHSSALANEGSYSDEGCRRLVIDPAQLGDASKKGQRGLHADPVDSLEQALIALQVGPLAHRGSII